MSAFQRALFRLQEWFIKGFYEGWANSEIGTITIVVTMLTTSLLALYIFFVYRFTTKKTFYSKSFNISLACVSVITAAIIVTVQSSVVVSLGMVGALSIVRFRTAIKDPMDLAFLFWSISVGIICGAGFAEFAIILSLVLTVGIFVLDRIPVGRAPMILVVNAADLHAEEPVMEIVNRLARHAQVKARNMTAASLDLSIELRTENGEELIRQIVALDGVSSASLLSHDGEVTF